MLEPFYTTRLVVQQRTGLNPPASSSSITVEVSQKTHPAAVSQGSGEAQPSAPRLPICSYVSRQLLLQALPVCYLTVTNIATRPGGTS